MILNDMSEFEILGFIHFTLYKESMKPSLKQLFSPFPRILQIFISDMLQIHYESHLDLWNPGHVLILFPFLDVHIFVMNLGANCVS